MLDLDSGLDFFKIIALIFPIVFIFVFAGIFLTLLKGLKQWNNNNKQPQQSISAKVAMKSTMISKRHRQISQKSTSYYIMFEGEEGDRIEFQVDGTIYGQLIENDEGKLTYQGTRFIKFDREFEGV